MILSNLLRAVCGDERRKETNRWIHCTPLELLRCVTDAKSNDDETLPTGGETVGARDDRNLSDHSSVVFFIASRCNYNVHAWNRSLTVNDGRFYFVVLFFYGFSLFFETLLTIPRVQCFFRSTCNARSARYRTENNRFSPHRRTRWKIRRAASLSGSPLLLLLYQRLLFSRTFVGGCSVHDFIL